MMGKQFGKHMTHRKLIDHVMVRRFIYEHTDDYPAPEGQRHVNIDLLAGYCKTNLKNFNELIDHLQECFGADVIDRDQCEISTVIESTEYNRFTVVQWKGFIPSDMEISDQWAVRRGGRDYYVA